MIFVTVGTHEQPFDRLVRKVDELKASGAITEDVVIQTGFSEYEPEHCEWQKLYPFQEMTEKVREARIVITHGGPSSFIMPLQVGKIPIVVPRRKEFNEHVNDHQVEFSHAVADRHGNIIVVDDTEKLIDIINDYSNIVGNMSSSMQSNNAEFNRKLDSIVRRMFRK